MKAVILGAGESGIHLARRLSQSEHDPEIILVDRDPKALAAAEEAVDVLTMVGDVAHFGVQERAHVPKADLVVALTGNDETNLASAALAAQLGATRTMARADAAGFYRTQMAVEGGAIGITHLLCASRLVERELRRLIRGCHAELVEEFASYSVRVTLMTVADDSPVLGQAGASMRAPGAERIAAVVRDGVLRHPAEIGRLEIGDRVLLVGTPTDVAVAQQQLLQTLRKRRVVLIGGGDVGCQLAATMSLTERRVQIVEHDAARCRQLAEMLPAATIVHGDGTSIALLRDQQIQSADYVVAVTRSDEANLMVSLLATDLGVSHTFAIVHRHGYSDVYAHLGVHGTAGPHEVIAKTVLGLLPEGGVLARQRLPDCSHEVVEYLLDSGLAHEVTVDDLALPPGCLLLAVVRDDSLVPCKSGMVLQARDHLLLAQPLHSRKEVIKRMQRLAKGKS